jgi:hypothetical protein
VLTSLPPTSDVLIRIGYHYGDADGRVEWRQGHPDHFSAIHGEDEAPRTTCPCSRATEKSATDLVLQGDLALPARQSFFC